MYREIQDCNWILLYLAFCHAMYSNSKTMKNKATIYIGGSFEISKVHRATETLRNTNMYMLDIGVWFTVLHACSSETWINAKLG